MSKGAIADPSYQRPYCALCAQYLIVLSHSAQCLFVAQCLTMSSHSILLSYRIVHSVLFVAQCLTVSSHSILLSHNALQCLRTVSYCPIAQCRVSFCRTMPYSAFAQCRIVLSHSAQCRTAIFPLNQGRRHVVEFQRILTGLTAQRGQRLDQRQMRAEGWARCSTDSANNDLVQTCLYQAYTRQRTATHCTALHRTATHCNTLQHTTTHDMPFLYA